MELAKYLPSCAPWRRLHGFDISSSQFPNESQIQAFGGNDVVLSVHDALTRYPVEHRGRYDLVHIRLLTAGLKEDEYKAVLNNAKELLSTYQSRAFRREIKS